MSRKNKILTVVLTCMCLMVGSITVNAENYTSITQPTSYGKLNSGMFIENSTLSSKYSYMVQIATHNITNDAGTSIYDQYYTLYSSDEIVFYYEDGFYYALSTAFIEGIYVNCFWWDVTQVNDSHFLQVSECNCTGSANIGMMVCQGIRDIEIISMYNSTYIFDSYDTAKAYLQTGSMVGLLEEPSKIEYMEDGTLGFEQFQVRRIQDTSIGGGTGVLVTFELPPGTYNANTPKKILYELNFTYNMVQNSGYLANKLDKSYYVENETITFVVEDDLTSDYGQRVFDFISLCRTSGIDEDSLAWLIMCMNNYCIENNSFFEWGSNFLASVIDAPDDFFDTNLYYACTDMSVNISACVVEDSKRSKYSYGYVDLVTGENQSMTIQGNDVQEDGTIIEGEVIESENMMDAKKQLNPDGTISYVDVNVNVDVDGSSGSGSVVQNNNVSIPDNITVNVNNGSGGNVNIEDDDYSADSLKQLIDGGAGIFDNLDKEKNDDGFLSMLTNFFGGIDDDLAGALGFGMGSTILICVLRSIFRR